MSAMDPLFQQAMQLPRNKREIFALRLLETVDGSECEKIEDAWVKLASVRRDEIASGAADTISWEDVEKELAELGGE